MNLTIQNELQSLIETELQRLKSKENSSKTNVAAAEN